MGKGHEPETGLDSQSMLLWPGINSGERQCRLVPKLQIRSDLSWPWLS